MRLVIVGVNHKTAPVALRERLAFAHDLTDAVQSIRADVAQVEGVVIVSTCNRSELYLKITEDGCDYCHEDETDDGPFIKKSATLSKIKAWLADFKHIALYDLEPYLYVYEDMRALTHWLRVASGLDSMILGEPQILGQMKQAVSHAKSAGGVSGSFGWLTEQVFAAARQIRRDTKVGAQAVTLGFAAARLVTQIFDNPTQTTLMLVAAGEMNRLVAHNVATLGMSHIIICNRTRERAQALASELECAGRRITIATLDEIGEYLAQADVVSSCSGSMQALIDVGMVKHALKMRRYEPMLLVDLAVPRDIAPEVAHLDNVYLYSIDDLQHVIAGNLDQRRQAAVDAELLVSQLTVEIERRLQVREVGQDIEQYRCDAIVRSDALKQAALAKLQQGADPKEVIEILTHRLSQTLIHAPSHLMQETARHGSVETLDFVVQALQSAYRK